MATAADTRPEGDLDAFRAEVKSFLKENTFGVRWLCNVKDNVEMIEEKLTRYRPERIQTRSDFSLTQEKNVNFSSSV